MSLTTIFEHCLYVVCFLLGNSLVSEFCMPTLQNTLFHLHRRVRMKNSSYVPAYEDGTDCVLKCWHIKFGHQKITQKKACNIQGVVKV
jgi:hypothetical protein